MIGFPKSWNFEINDFRAFFLIQFPSSNGNVCLTKSCWAARLCPRSRTCAGRGTTGLGSWGVTTTWWIHPLPSLELTARIVGMAGRCHVSFRDCIQASFFFWTKLFVMPNLMTGSKFNHGPQAKMWTYPSFWGGRKNGDRLCVIYLPIRSALLVWYYTCVHINSTVILRCMYIWFNPEICPMSYVNPILCWVVFGWSTRRDRSYL